MSIVIACQKCKYILILFNIVVLMSGIRLKSRQRTRSCRRVAVLGAEWEAAVFFILSRCVSVHGAETKVVKPLVMRVLPMKTRYLCDAV